MKKMLIASKGLIYLSWLILIMSLFYAVFIEESSPASGIGTAVIIIFVCLPLFILGALGIKFSHNKENRDGVPEIKKTNKLLFSTVIIIVIIVYYLSGFLR